MSVTLLDVGTDVKAMYRDLLSVGSSLMRVEDHLSLGVPGAEVELEETRRLVQDLLTKVDQLLPNLL